jgi:hypothetical protein
MKMSLTRSIEPVSSIYEIFGIDHLKSDLLGQGDQRGMDLL